MQIEKFMSQRYSLFAWSAKTVVAFEPMIQFFLILQDFKCPKPVQQSSFCDSLRFNSLFGLGSAVNTAKKEVELISDKINQLYRCLYDSPGHIGFVKYYCCYIFHRYIIAVTSLVHI